jgi:chemotaxis protein MotB
MARVQSLLVVTLLTFAAGGCVTQEKYNALKMEADQYATQLSTSEREKGEAIAGRDLLQRQLDKIGQGGDQKDALVVNQANEISQLQREKAELNEKLAKAYSQVGTTVVLDPQLNAALKEFASQNADLVEYDQNRGMVKFKSDVTFSPGSAVLTSNAATAIDRFATILNSQAAMGYELMVVGHTDNVKVSHDATKRAGHFDNWYLSAHRAISVSSELQKQGVSSGRLEVAGCADQRPIASNSTEAGKAQNRRVEVVILPTTVHSPVAAASSPQPVHAAMKIKSEPNKDFNKDAVAPSPKTSAYNK